MLLTKASLAATCCCHKPPSTLRGGRGGGGGAGAGRADCGGWLSGVFTERAGHGAMVSPRYTWSCEDMDILVGMLVVGSCCLSLTATLP